MNLLRRILYAIALVLALPLFPLWLLGIFLDIDGNYGTNGSYFRCIALGLLFFAMILAEPFLALGKGIKWVATGR